MQIWRWPTSLNLNQLPKIGIHAQRHLDVLSRWAQLARVSITHSRKEGNRQRFYLIQVKDFSAISTLLSSTHRRSVRSLRGFDAQDERTPAGRAWDRPFVSFPSRLSVARPLFFFEKRYAWIRSESWRNLNILLILTGGTKPSKRRSLRR
jgi:hypothetical protein